jgi:hypothetical protein
LKVGGEAVGILPKKPLCDPFKVCLLDPTHVQPLGRPALKTSTQKIR